MFFFKINNQRDFFRIHHHSIVNSVCCSHALVGGRTSKMPASGGSLDVVGTRAAVKM